MWEGSTEEFAVRFVGVSRQHGRRQILDQVAPPAVGLAQLDQIHSARIVEATDGVCGKADGLVTMKPLLALSVVTADCVPVLLGDRLRIAAIHAGWRGIAAGIVTVAVSRLQGMKPTEPSPLTAWIGPAIAPCCYEVSPEVAARVAAASADEVRIQYPGSRPHLDLQLAVQRQLEACGVPEIHLIRACTRCHPQWLHSYRRDGRKAGRNHAFIWLRGHQRAAPDVPIQ